MLKLVIEDDEGQQTVVPLVRDEITIGRQEGNTIRLTERNVSRRHARLTKVDTDIFVEDVAARYGIKFNGKKLEERQKFEPGDEVQIGDYMLTVQDESTKQVQAMDEPDGPQPIPEHRAGKLVVISSNYAGQEFPLTSTEMVVGRTDDNDIIINHGSISRNHAKVIYNKQSRAYRIEDMESANGVKVNGRSVGAIEMRSGDIVELGHVRFRYCEPGELWSFEIMMAHMAMMEEPIKAPGSTGKIVLLVIITLLVVGAAVFFIMSQGSDEAEGSTGSAPATAEGTSPTDLDIEVDPQAVQSLILDCEDKLSSKPPDINGAIRACREALNMDPENEKAQAKYDRVIREQSFMSHYDNAKELLSVGSCELAGQELEKVTDPKSMVARMIRDEGLTEQAQDCLEDELVSAVEGAANDYLFDDAEENLKKLKATFPESGEIARLEAHIPAMREKQEKERKERRKSSSGSDSGDSGSDSGSKEPELSADEKKAKAEAAEKAGMSALKSKDFGGAADKFKEALKYRPSDTKLRARYAIALDKNGDICKALKQYKKIENKIKGRLQKEAKKKIEEYSAECN